MASSTSELKGAGWGAFWWIAAALLHVSALLAVIYFTPLRQWFMSKEDPDEMVRSLGAGRMRQIVRQLVRAHTRHVRETVRQQQEVLAQLRDLAAQRYDRYVEQARRERQRGTETPAPQPRDIMGPLGPDVETPLSEQNLFALYDSAQTVEKASFEAYRQLRVAELARIQALPLREANDATNVHVPPRPKINVEIFYQDIQRASDPRLKALKDEIRKVRVQTEDMLAEGSRMLELARGIQTADVLGVTISGPGGTLFEGGGVTRWGSDIGPSLRPEEYFPGARASDFGEDFRPTWGRKLMDAGRKANWMFIDTWYVIGPFPNPNRLNIDRKFPPESMPGGKVDLDRSYIGKDGRKLRWQFRQSRRLMQVPYHVTNYAIWYAYTEVYAENPQDRWVVFGSDDYSRVWLNGEKIYTSGIEPHHWIPDRGWRKVHFRKGYNRMLVKIENAGGTMGYSVVIYLGSAAGEAAAAAE